MNSIQSKKILSLFLIVSMLSHVTFLHNYLDDYVLCYGNDGHTAIEKLNDCDEYLNLEVRNSTEFNNNVHFNNDDCTDFPIFDSCFEDNEFVIDKKVNFGINFISNILHKVKPQYKTKHILITNLTTLKDSILESYSTVSLLI